MTDTVDDARSATEKKRRARPRPRRRPQSRTPSTPMGVPTAGEPPGSGKTSSDAPVPPALRGEGVGGSVTAGQRAGGAVQRGKPASASERGRVPGRTGGSDPAAGDSGEGAASGEAARPGGVPEGQGGGGSGEKPRRPRRAGRRKPEKARSAPGSALEAVACDGAARKSVPEPEAGATEVREPGPDVPEAREPEPDVTGPDAAERSGAAESDDPSAPADDGGRSRAPVRAWRAGGLARRLALRGRGRPRGRAAFRRCTRSVRAGVGRLVRPTRPRRLPLPRWWPAALCVLAGLLAGLAYGLLRPVQYTATSYVAVVPGKEGDPVTALGFAQAYGRIATDTAVLAKAQQESGVPVATLRGSVEAVTSPDAPMIEVTGHAPRAGEAADVANAVARSLTEVADGSAKATGVELTAFSRARAPREPSTPSAALTSAVGGSSGVLVGALVLLVRPRRDERRDRSTGAASAGGEPGSRDPRPHGTVRENEAVR